MSYTRIFLALGFAVQLLIGQISLAQWPTSSSTNNDDIPPGRGLASRPIFQHDHYRATFGGGSSFALATDAPVAFAGSIAWQHDHQLLSLGFIESGSNTRTQPQHTWDEFDLLYGYAIDGYDIGAFGFHPERIFASISTGLSFYNYGARYRRPRGFFQQFDTTTYPPNSALSGIGIPVQVQAIYAPFTFLGIGLTAFANLNLKQINYGGVFSVQVIYY